MITSRRGFLRFGAGAATAAAMQWPLLGVLRADAFESSRFKQDDGFVRLNSNENVYGPSLKVADAIKSAIGSANRYPRMEYAALAERIPALLQRRGLGPETDPELKTDRPI